ncbi:unnamed protein product [Zymoseptoria tritici ST99CH_1E4]|uniref:CBM20 domain-containing protein n=1 Tax=Zymoseptoria tritici ST99CH_1E4 TaxID=1276532 RepID=A0A2H1H8N1_ZYMTR|nr:unnamed protein product [Zymoseptoria tritici ST99CH_1E4]
MAPLSSLLCASLAFAGTAIASSLSPIYPRQNSTAPDCPGYRATDVKTTANGLSAKLTLAGNPCNVFGTDLEDLTLTVEYQTDARLHVLIEDAAQQVYQVPESVLTRPVGATAKNGSSELIFDYVKSPFSFSVKRRSSGDVLFDSSAASLIFEDQYVRLRTSLPQTPNLYGTGEHSDSFKLNTTDYTRTAWNRDAYGAPPGSNLYGTHPVYYDHRGDNGTHAVFLLNSNGMDYKINNDGNGTNGQYLEYNLLGGVLDLYFLAGPSPVEAAQQYSEVVGKAAMMPYWGFGFHQCKYGYRDVYEVAEVVANYSAANIPLETMWTDIDYMNLRWVFTLDEYRYPLKLMRQLVDTLHSRDQHYVVMVDPAVAYEDYPAFNEGVEAGAFMVSGNGSVYKGVVWPGVTAFPDWFHPSTQDYWNSQFTSFFNADTGVDIDALWIDMNEPSNFCNYPCADPEGYAASNGFPPQPPAIRLGSPRPIPGFPTDFQPLCKAQVTFNVNASTNFGENIVVFGSAVTIGNGSDIKGAAPLNANNYPIWSATVDLPVNTRVSYQFVRTQTDGSYVYETGSNRTITTGGCNSTVQSTNDIITTSSPSTASKVRRFTEFSHNDHSLLHHARQTAGNKIGLPGRDLIDPGYKIDNDAGSLSNKTADTDIVQYGGYVQYDTHNVYGSQMSVASRKALLERRPARRPMIITRSTFAGSGASVGKWLGDNYSSWAAYLESIVGILNFGTLYQSPMVGADVCGFGGDTTENLCARWASLGAFSPFYRNHAQNDARYQEFYLWESVAESARNAIEIRYKLLDYIYTAMYFQSEKGTPLIQPMFFHYPLDSATFALDKQYFWGPGLLVAPVTVENATSATFYLPDDLFYDYYTHEAVKGTGADITLPDVPFTSIPLYYKSGVIFPQRVNSANTTTELREQDFELVIALSEAGTAEGDLYLDDGDSLVQASTSLIHFEYADGKLEITGTFEYDIQCAITKITVLGAAGGDGTTSRIVQPDVNIALTGSYSGSVEKRDDCE